MNEPRTEEILACVFSETLHSSLRGDLDGKAAGGAGSALVERR
jgi:hypothetical protein